MRGLPGINHSELNQHLSDLYAPACNCQHPHLNNLAAGGIEEALTKMVLEIWRNKNMPPAINVPVTKHYANLFFNAVEEGFGNKIIDVDFDTPDYLMLRKLQESVFHFSAAKNYQQLKALSQALINSDGKLRTFKEFKEQAFKINQDHVHTWLKAEYDMAVCTGQASASWVRIIENKSVLPNLEYDSVLDQRTTDVCYHLNGVIKPVDDSFWDIYFIPNHWGERATIRQLAGGKITPSASIVHPEKMHDMFKTNMAKNGFAFPPGHAYYKGLPHQVSEQANNLIKSK